MRYSPDIYMVNLIAEKSISDRLNVQLTQENDFLCSAGVYKIAAQLRKNPNATMNLGNAARNSILYHERDPMRLSNTRDHAYRSRLSGFEYLGETTEMAWHKSEMCTLLFHKTGHFFVDGSPGSLIERAQDRAKINPRI